MQWGLVHSVSVFSNIVRHLFSRASDKWDVPPGSRTICRTGRRASRSAMIAETQDIRGQIRDLLWGEDVGLASWGASL